MVENASWFRRSSGSSSTVCSLRSGRAISSRRIRGLVRRGAGCSMRGALAVAASAVFALACARRGATATRVVVKNPDYLVVRPIRREADSEHTIPVELPYAGAGYGFAWTAALLDMNSFDLRVAAFAGGRAE